MTPTIFLAQDKQITTQPKKDKFLSHHFSLFLTI